MYIQFYPQENFFHNFPIKERKLFTTNNVPDELTGLLCRAYYMAPERPNVKADRTKHAVFVATVDDNPFLKEQYKHLPSEFIKLEPESFAVILSHPENPAIWLGGRDQAGLRKTCDFFIHTLHQLVNQIPCAGDFHLHTTVSDGLTKPENVITEILVKHLDICAITDHNTLDGAEQVATSHPAKIICVLPGQELTDSLHNHILVIGPDADKIPRGTPEKVLEAAANHNVFISHAHATSTEYFTGSTSTEAYNYLSSAPLASREYIARQLEAGHNIAALGNSDAHLTADIGRARTFMLLDKLRAENVTEALNSGQTAAFMEGDFTGNKELVDFFSFIYNHSDLLDGKLVPADISRRRNMAGLHHNFFPAEFGLIENHTKAELFGYLNNQRFRVAINGRHAFRIMDNNDRKIFFDTWVPNNVKVIPGTSQTLKALKTSAKKVFCNHKPCACKESRWSLKYLVAPYAIELGEAAGGIFEINHIKKQMHLHTCKEFDLRHLVNPGKNLINVSESFAELDNLRLGCGTEITDWKIRNKENPQWRPVGTASNLQIQNIAEHGFIGEFEYRTTLLEPSLKNGSPTLFFHGIDGIIDINIDSKLIFQRGANHWEDRMELELPGNLNFPCEMTIKLTNQVGLCGISNHAYIGGSVKLSSGENKLELPNDYDFAALRCGEPRVRVLVCDETGEIIEQFLADGMPHLIEYDNAVELRINCFENLPRASFPLAIVFSPSAAPAPKGL
jgi:PHP-associated